MPGKNISSLILVFLAISLVLMGCGGRTNSSDSSNEDSLQEEQESGEEADRMELSVNHTEDESDTLSMVFGLDDDIIKADEDPKAVEVFEQLKRINGNDLEYVTDKYGYITFLKGSAFEKPCQTYEDLEKAIDILLPALTSNNEMKLTPGEYIMDEFGNRYLLYKEQVDGEINESNVVKIYFDKDKNMLGLSASLFPNLNDSEEIIEKEEAVDIVKEAVKEEYPENDYYFYDNETKYGYRYLTDPVTGQGFNCKVFSVLTDNPFSDQSTSEAPFLEHYVSKGGIYIGCEPSNASIESAGTKNRELIDKWIDRSETASYSTVIDDINGKKQQITVPVAYDDGMYYLEDVERDILCADYWEFEYNDELKIISSQTNDDWNIDYITAYYNYITAYDFYADNGWIGPDGIGSPVILLMDYCNEDHTPINNLSYIGQFENAHLFSATSKGNEYHKLLDLIAHEYTHSVTTAALGNIIYRNETGAINEGLSDIMGELIELIHYDKLGNRISDDRTFLMGGDGSITVFRDIYDPEYCGQPYYAGGVFYAPPAAVPSSMNDMGGVHLNSSIISNLCYRMARDAELSYKDIGRIWETVINMLVPGTGFKELAKIIPMASELCGYGQYADTFRKCIEESLITEDDPFDSSIDDICNICFELPPWINWNRVRLDMVDENDHLHSSWPAKGKNRIKINVYPGKYSIQLTEFDEKGKPCYAWFYDGEKWGDQSLKGKQAEFKENISYELNHISINE